MTVEERLYAYLCANTGLSALVGPRVHPLVLPEGVTYPAVTYQKISHDVDHTLEDGKQAFAQPRYQVTAWGRTATETRSVAAAIAAALDGTTDIGTPVQASYVLDEHEFYEPVPQIYMRAVDVILQFNP